MQSHSNRCRCGPGQACDLEHRQIGVVAQEHRDTLVWRKFTKRIRQQRRQHSRPGHIRCHVRCFLRVEKTLAPKLRGTQPKRRAKHPRNWIPHASRWSNSRTNASAVASSAISRRPADITNSARQTWPACDRNTISTSDSLAIPPTSDSNALPIRATRPPKHSIVERPTRLRQRPNRSWLVHVLRPNPTDSHVYARPSDHSPGTARDGSLHLRRPQNQRSTVSHCCVTSPSPAVTHHSARESKGTNPVNPPITTLATPRVTVRTSLGAPNSLPVKPRMGRLLERLPRGAP